VALVEPDEVTAEMLGPALRSYRADAKRRRWITENPCEFAEKVSVTSSGECNVLEPERVHALARAADSDLLGAAFTVAAFTGLR
jgi:hypothetical protein